ncbi:MAG: hypothetical protein HQL11_04690 [Candidatus Omnitrophica bacterium]|nr:hypothetical protein [Candidatus Omnitrophota bacterium]
MTKKYELDGCPKSYFKWACFCMLLVGGFFVYLVYLNLTGQVDRTDPIWLGTLDATTSKALILTEHVNEEEDYDKPVCKRLEEESERYDAVDYGEI